MKIIKEKKREKFEKNLKEKKNSVKGTPYLHNQMKNIVVFLNNSILKHS